MSPRPSIFARLSRASRAGVASDSPTTTAAPLAAVRGAIAAGRSSRAEIAERTGLSRSTVDAAIDHLERTGMLRRERMATSCASGGCSGCDHAAAMGGACSAAPTSPDGERGPVALVLVDRDSA